MRTRWSRARSEKASCSSRSARGRCGSSRTSTSRASSAGARPTSSARSFPEGEVEGRALSQARLGPDAPAMALDEAADDREAHTRPFVLVGMVQALEDTEELVGVAHVEAGAVVLDEECGLPVRAGTRADLDPPGVAFARELHRVAEEVHQHLLHEDRVAARLAERSHVEAHLAAVH